MFQSPKSLERFYLYVTAYLVAVCLGSAVQTQAGKEKQSMEKTQGEATSCYSGTSVLLKQRNHFCAFMYLLTIRNKQQYFLSIWELFCSIVLPQNRLSFSYIQVQNSPENAHKLLFCSQYSTEHKPIAISHIPTSAKAAYRMAEHYFYFSLNSCSQSYKEK